MPSPAPADAGVRTTLDQDVWWTDILIRGIEDLLPPGTLPGVLPDEPYGGEW